MSRLTKKERTGILLLAAIIAVIVAMTFHVPDRQKPATIPDRLSETVADTLTSPTESTINESTNPAEHINLLKQKMKRQ